MVLFFAPARSRILPVALAWGLLGGSVAGLAQNAGQYPSGYGTQAYTPKNFQLPEGGGCSGDIARWRAVQGNDYASGNVNLRVYNQIQGEIARAEAACSAGQDAKARSLIAASKSRHGYPQ